MKRKHDSLSLGSIISRSSGENSKGLDTAPDGRGKGTNKLAFIGREHWEMASWDGVTTGDLRGGG